MGSILSLAGDDDGAPEAGVRRHIDEPVHFRLRRRRPTHHDHGVPSLRGVARSGLGERRLGRGPQLLVAPDAPQPQTVDERREV